ncbi:MAG: hypothetical protein IH947_15750 [Bacteroidetes bacterium]|nr:hypothetical protein [Bacteroidota bacterium]
MWVKQFIFLFLFLSGTVISITFLTSCGNDEPPGCGCGFLSDNTAIDTGYVDHSNSYSGFISRGGNLLCNEDSLNEFFVDQIVIIDASSTIPCVNDSVSRYMINTITPYQIEVPEISDEEYSVYLAVWRHFYPDSTLFTIWRETINDSDIPNYFWLPYFFIPDYPHPLAIEFFYYAKEVTALDVNGFTDPGVEIVLIDQQDLEAVNSSTNWLKPEFYETYMGTNGMNFFSRVAIKDNYAMLRYRDIVIQGGPDSFVLLEKDPEGWQVIRRDIWVWID